MCSDCICAVFLFDLLQSNNMRVPPHYGTIVYKGKKGKLRIFVYKFDKQHVTPCSKASSDDFKDLNDEDEERIFKPEIKLKM